MKLRDPTPCAPSPGEVGFGERHCLPLTDSPSTITYQLTSEEMNALNAPPPPAPEPIDYAHAFRVWWHQAVNPAVPPSRTAAETHVLFAQHMVLVELERAGRFSSTNQRAGEVV